MRFHLTCICAVAVCIPIPSSAQQAPPPIRQFDIPALERLAVDMYRQDQEAWKATDALEAVHPRAELVGDKVGGWLVEARPDGDVVRFFRKTDAGLEAAYDIPFAAGAPQPVSMPVDKSITAEERAQFSARALALQNITQHCSRDYNTIILKDPEGDGWLVWVMAATNDPNAVMIGQHYRFTISPDGGHIERKDELSRSCLTLTKEIKGDNKLAAMVATQLVSDIPVETTLFLSLQHKLPLIVITPPDGVIWQVENGKVQKIGHVSPKTP